MPTVSQVATPPAKPVMLFDGNCGFCAFWIRRWQQATGERVEYIPFQDTRTAEWFPELPREQLALAVHLIESNGAVCRGAEAVCRSLATNPARQWPLRWYQKCPRFAAMAESAYRFVAGHRPRFSALTHALWPKASEEMLTTSRPCALIRTTKQCPCTRPAARHLCSSRFMVQMFWAKEMRSRYLVRMVCRAATSASTCRSSGAWCGVSRMISKGIGSISTGAASTPS